MMNISTTTNEEKKQLSNHHEESIYTITPDVTMAAGCSSAPLLSSSKKSLSSSTKSSSLPPLTPKVRVPQDLYLPALDHDDEARNDCRGNEDMLTDSLFLPRSMSLLLPEDKDTLQTGPSHHPYLQFVWEDTNSKASVSSKNNDDGGNVRFDEEQNETTKKSAAIRLPPAAQACNHNRSSSPSFRSLMLQPPSYSHYSDSSASLSHGHHRQQASSSMGFKPLQSEEHIMQMTKEKQRRRPPLIPFASSNNVIRFRSRQHTTSNEDEAIMPRMSPTVLTSKRRRKTSGFLKLKKQDFASHDSTSKENINHLSSSSSYDFDNIDESSSLTLPSTSSFSCQGCWPRQGSHLFQRCHYFDPDEHRSCF